MGYFSYIKKYINEKECLHVFLKFCHEDTYNYLSVNVNIKSRECFPFGKKNCPYPPKH